jgi:hypothetical protein
LNHITKKPKSLGKRKSWEQRAKSKVAITTPSTKGCSYQPLHTIPSAKATSGFKSNLVPYEPKFVDAPKASPEQLTKEPSTHIYPKSKFVVEHEPQSVGFDEVAYQAMVSRYARFNK